MFWLFMTHRNKVAKLLFSSIEAPKQIISLIYLKNIMKILTKMSKRDSWFCKYDVLPLLQWILREAKWRVVPCPATWSHKDQKDHHQIQTLSSSPSNITNIIIITISAIIKFKWHFPHHILAHSTPPLLIIFPLIDIAVLALHPSTWLPLNQSVCTGCFFTVPPLKMTTVWTHNLFTLFTDNLFLNKIGSWQLT